MKGEPFETHVDRLIRESIERGEFDDLPGEGEPIPGAGTVDVKGWWIRKWVERNRPVRGQPVPEPEDEEERQPSSEESAAE